MTESNPLLRLVAAACAIVAIALAAATVRSPLETGSDGSGSGATPGDGSGGQPPPPEQVSDGTVPPFLEALIYLVIGLLAIVFVWYLITHRRDAIKLIAIGLVVALIMVTLSVALLELSSLFGSEMTPEEGGEFGEESGDGDSPGSDGELTPITGGPLLALLALVTVIFLGGLFLSRGSDESAATAAERTADGTDSQATAETAAVVGTAAGNAADRIEDTADVENAVYRAWREMTRPLEVDRPESSTPREFARAATDAGMDRDHVGELTQLFEDVRYGDASTTPEREARAVAVLRRIEAEYAESTGRTLRDEPVDDSVDSVGRGENQ
ncbi:DUF4129 domain-containing protein [Natronorubrum sp. JWXQ-INN-674]|uniref:DUF4129 domain-containing protein n=1 Tax=Natronorubrum halalkaliphilum TaxID=2691917 RepID=A0A6B0VMG3_9EURY|nr:DUF4129 domain-containing protein [Natronorubrum halalkaliphilum]MXV62770.1 DUF4129 domain-containing protein [Natronorubrum halalkaliphilum]